MNNLTARRRLLGADVEKRISVGNPIGVISLARMYPGIKMQGVDRTGQHNRSTVV